MTVNAQATTQTTSSPGYFRPRRLGHVNLYISDYEKSLHFYRKICGLPDGWTRPAIGGGFLNNGSTHHDIGFIPWDSGVARRRADGPGLNHLAFELENEAELVASYEAAVAGGTEFIATVDHLVAKSLYSWDPHKFGIEIYSDTGLSADDPDFAKLRRATADWSPVLTPTSHVRHYVAEHEHKPKIDKSALFHSQKLTGAVLVSDAFEAACDYYTSIVGLTPVGGGRDRKFVILAGSCGSHDVTLVRAGEARGPGFHHMSFVVFDEGDLEASIAKAKDFGVTIEHQIDHPRRRGAVVSDPDGMKVLFYVDRKQNLKMDDIEAGIDGEAIWLT